MFRIILNYTNRKSNVYTELRLWLYWVPIESKRQWITGGQFLRIIYLLAHFCVYMQFRGALGMQAIYSCEKKNRENGNISLVLMMRGKGGGGSPSPAPGRGRGRRARVRRLQPNGDHMSQSMSSLPRRVAGKMGSATRARMHARMCEYVCAYIHRYICAYIHI